MESGWNVWVWLVGVASGSGWNLWVWLLGVVVGRYIDFLILLIPTPLVSVLFCSSIPTFCSFCYIYIYICIQGCAQEVISGGKFPHPFSYMYADINPAHAFGVHI